ncbi:MAG: rhomboid family intramembrane serine protease [Solirubrobacterales bacterium]
MSETELRVVCKSCGAEVSPYVTECPYCGARVRKRAPKLERRDGGLEAKKSRREKRRERQAERAVSATERPWATFALILVPAVAMLVRIATGGDFIDYGALLLPFDSEWWRFLTAPFAYTSVGYLFAVSLAMVMFVPGIERRLGSVATLILLVACGSLGMFAAYGVEEQRSALEFIGGGNGVALGAIAAWFVIIRNESKASGDDEDGPDVIGVLVCVAVILLLPVVVDSANVWSGLAGGAIGALAGLVATLVRR